MQVPEIEPQTCHGGGLRWCSTEEQIIMIYVYVMIYFLLRFNIYVCLESLEEFKGNKKLRVLLAITCRFMHWFGDG